jgi:hypothetical protein
LSNHQHRCLFRILLIVVSGFCVLLIKGVSFGQPGRAAGREVVSPSQVRALDKEAERLQEEFIQSLVKLADGYEAAGDVERTQATLEKVLELDPDREGVQSRLDELKNRVFNENEVVVDVDVARGWVGTGLKVRKDEEVRFSATGTYKFIANATLTPDGVATQDVQREMVEGIRLGRLMGVVLPPPKGRQKPELGKPFALGSESSFTPEESGLLFLKLNVPPGTKSVGSVKVSISGNFDR